MKWLLPFIFAPIATAIVFYFKGVFDLRFEVILILIIFLMWTELNIRIGELKK